MQSDSAPNTALLRLDRVVVFVASLLLGTLALSSPLLAGINGMRVTACRCDCSTTLVGAGAAVIMAGPIGATVLALALLLLPRPDRCLWWLACSALTVATATLLLGEHLIDLGTGT